MNKTVSGFSKFNKSEKIDWLVENYLSNSSDLRKILERYFNPDVELQKLHDEFIENTISNFYLPLGISPNFLINDKVYAIPMVTEESSVVAAASNAAKFWLKRGGFKAEVLSTQKIGQVHFTFDGDAESLQDFFGSIKTKLFEDAEPLTASMEKRGGGILDIELIDRTHKLKNYYQLHAAFDTRDAMGANFINSCLEQFAQTLNSEALKFEAFKRNDYHLEVVMSILSNYVPNCVAKAEVSCKTNELKIKGFSGGDFAEKFVRAVEIAKVEPHRAVTHNKGVMNGVDAVVIATGNDFRAVEAGVHAYAAKDGTYKSLTDATLENDILKFSIEIPLAVGTVGGLTNLHPLVKICHKILGSPNANELMMIMAVSGLAQNFAALKSLVTTGIQEGHMKMHLINILNQMNASKDEKEQLVKYFKSHTVSHSAVVNEIEKIRQ